MKTSKEELNYFFSKYKLKSSFLSKKTKINSFRITNFSVVKKNYLTLYVSLCFLFTLVHILTKC